SCETRNRTNGSSHPDLKLNHFIALESGQPVTGSLFLFQKQAQTEESAWLQLSSALSAREMSNVWSRMKNGSAAKREPNGRVTARKGGSGLLLYGTYIRLAPGSYRLRVKAAALDTKPRNTGVLRIDVVGDREVLASKIFTSSDLRSRASGLEFTVPKRLGVGT